MEKFCTYLNKQCKKSNTSIRQLAKQSHITHPYLLELMNGKKIAPDIDTQINLADALKLNKDEKQKFFDLAAKERHAIPADIYKSILKDEEKWKKIRNEMGE